MPISEEEILWSYRVILGHEPESDAIVSGYRNVANIEELRDILLASDEFRSQHSMFGNQYSPVTASGYSNFFRNLFAACGGAPVADSSSLLDRIQRAVTAVQKEQADYQPFYGLGDLERSARHQNLLQSIELIRDHFKNVAIKNKVRILDTGCNNGYVTFKLAETFPLTRGIDINPRSIALCSDLALYTGSLARFKEVNLLQVLESGSADFENVDCILLLNVVHQMIFARGIPYVRNILAKLAREVDVMFLELATKQDYMKHQLDDKLPEDPGEVLGDIENCRIDLLRTYNRPLYKVTRRKVSYNHISLWGGAAQFGLSALTEENRKYYTSGGRFLKLFRFTDDKQISSFCRERDSLLALAGSKLAPRIFDWTLTETYGAVLMEHIEGTQLQFNFRRFSTPNQLRLFLKDYLSVAAILGQHNLYHNDLSPHNILVLPGGGIRFIDFEQSDSRSYTDPFAIMLWTLFDLLSKEDVAGGKLKVYKKLYLKKGENRVARDCYPDFSSFDLSSEIRPLIDDAIAAGSWFEFVKKWSIALT